MTMAANARYTECVEIIDPLDMLKGLENS